MKIKVWALWWCPPAGHFQLEGLYSTKAAAERAAAVKRGRCKKFKFHGGQYHCAEKELHVSHKNAKDAVAMFAAYLAGDKTAALAFADKVAEEVNRPAGAVTRQEMEAALKGLAARDARRDRSTDGALCKQAADDGGEYIMELFTRDEAINLGRRLLGLPEKVFSKKIIEPTEITEEDIRRFAARSSPGDVRIIDGDEVEG